VVSGPGDREASLAHRREVGGRLVEDLDLGVRIRVCPIVREPDGLARSSRNHRLSSTDRLRAPLFYKVLSSAPSAEEAADDLRQSGFAVDYVEDRDGRRLGAVRLGDVRLIDNVLLQSDR